MLYHARTTPDHDSHQRERRLALLFRRLPNRVQTWMHWLLQPSARWVRIPAGILLTLGGVMSILPVFGLWMLPFGLILLAEDVGPLRRLTDRCLHWIEHRRPHWMGLPPVSNPTPRRPERNAA